MLWKLGENEIRIEDTNFIVNDTLIARKQVFSNSDPVQLWEVEAKITDEEKFKQMIFKYKCPEF